MERCPHGITFFYIFWDQHAQIVLVLCYRVLSHTSDQWCIRSYRSGRSSPLLVSRLLLRREALSIISISLLAVEGLSDFSPLFFTGLLEAVVAALLMNVYIVGLNQLFDIEIDKVNKPNLPLVSGEYSLSTGIAIVSAFVVMSFGIGWLVGSWQLFFALFVSFILGTAYSLDDIPDIDGDQIFGIRSFSVRLGQKWVFWICIYLLEMAYTVAMLIGASSSCLWSKLITDLGHAVLALILWNRARTLDCTSKASITSFYMFIWKLFYAEYLLIPLVR